MKTIDAPLYIFVHTPKTAGTTFIKNVTRNLKPRQFLELNPETLNTDQKINASQINATNKLLAKMKPSKLNQVRFIYGHTVPYGIHKYFDREVRYITFIRNPAKRIVSQYNYLNGQYNHGLDRNLQRRFKDIFFTNGKPMLFTTWYKHKFLPEDQDLTLLNTFQSLSKLGYISKNSKNEKDFTRDLNKFFFIGITKNFANDSLFLYHLMGVKKYFFSENISAIAVNIAKNPKIITQIYKDHPRVKKLFLAAQKMNKEFINNHPEYWQAVRRQRLKRLILMPFTHLLFDPRSLAREIRKKFN